VTPRFIIRNFNQSANGSATATNVPLTASRGPQYQLNDSSQVAWTWVVSPASLLDSRVELRRNHIQNGCFAAPTPLGFSTSLTAINTPTINYNNAVTLGCAGRWGDAFEKGWFVNEAFTTTRGPHTLKVGGIFAQPLNHVVETQNQTARTMSVALFTPPTRRRIRSCTASASSRGAAGWALGGNQYGLLRKTPGGGQGLTLSLGLRYDAEAKVSSLNDASTMKPPYNTHLNHVDPNKATSRRVASRGRERHHAAGDPRRLRCSRHRKNATSRMGRAGRQSADAGGLLMSISANTATLNPYCPATRGAPPACPRISRVRCARSSPPRSSTHRANLAATSVTVTGTTALPGVAISPIPLTCARGPASPDAVHPSETIAQFDLGRGCPHPRRKFIQGRDQHILRNVNVTTAGQIIDPCSRR
jgi:hypothetical protein